MPWSSSDATAFDSPEGTRTFRELAVAADRAALALERNGVASRSLVVICLPSAPAFPEILLALFRIDAVPALLAPGAGRAEWEALESDLGPLALVAGEETALRFGAAGRPAADLEAAAGGTPVRLFRPEAPAAPARPGDALIKFTSGSSGRPKGIALGADNLRAEADNVIRTLGLRPGTRVMAPVPLHHSYGFDLGVLPMLFGGARLRADGGFVPGRVLQRLESGAADVFLGVPAMYRFLVDTTERRAPAALRAGHLLSCTAPLQPELLLTFLERFGAPICQHYGSSETGAVANHVPSRVASLPESVGRPMHGVTVAIVDGTGRPLPAGESGEIRVSGPAVARGYRTAGIDPDPFGPDGYRTGDRGVLDAEGFLTVLGRLDDLINVGGFKVGPLEVQRVIETHPRVREAFVYGAADRAGGEVVEALVVPRGDLSESGLLDFCRQRLADYKIPRRIVFRDALPRSPSGKVVRPDRAGEP